MRSPCHATATRRPIARPVASPGRGSVFHGRSGAVPVRPVNAANPVESTDRLGEGSVLREPTKPSAPDEENRDWTLPIEKKDKPSEADAP